MNGLRRTLRIPAGSCQMPRQHIAFEYAAGAGQRHPCRAERHHQRFEFRNQRWRDVLRFVAFLELEPVEAVGPQRDHVRQFADRGKASSAEHLQGNAILPGRKVELGRLRRARQVRNAEDHLVAILPDIGKHRAIGRADECHRAAAERQIGLAH